MIGQNYINANGEHDIDKDGETDGTEIDSCVAIALAEDPHVLERLIVSPAAGLFHPDSADVVTGKGQIVRQGQPVGAIQRNGDLVTVVSSHSGVMMGMLVLPGERVRPNQPVAWVRVT